MQAADDEETPGLAGQRTDMAWSRSGLAMLAVVAAVVKRILDIDDATASVLVIVLIAGGAAAWALALAHAQVIGGAALAGRPQPEGEKLRFVAWGTTALGVAALVLALVPD